MNAKAKHHFKKWKYQSPIGLATIGTGVCLVAEAAIQKYDGAVWWAWGSYGTVALIVLNAGISLFVDAALHRIRYEQAIKEVTH